LAHPAGRLKAALFLYVKIPVWVRWDFNRPKSDIKKVRQRTDQMIKHQQLQKELQGDTQGKERSQEQ
jgi:hypothetical protein